MNIDFASKRKVSCRGAPLLLALGVFLLSTTLYVSTDPAHCNNIFVGAVTCTSNPIDVTPAPGATVDIIAGACSGDIIVTNDGITVNILAGAGEFRAGKSIVLPASGATVNFKLFVTGVNWAVSQGLFTGATPSLDLQGALIEFKDSTIASTVDNPIGFFAIFSTSSQYTLNTTTLSVTGSVNGLLLWSFVDSALSISGSQATGTVNQAVRVSNQVLRSTISITEGSQLTTTLDNNVYSLRFAAVTDSTLMIAGGSQVSATSTHASGTATSIYLSTFTNSVLSIEGAQVTADAPLGSTPVHFGWTFIDSRLSITHSSTIVANGPHAETTAVYFSHSPALTRPSITIANSVIQSTKYSFRHHPDAFVTNKIGTISLCLSTFTGPSDGTGPLTGSTIQQNADGTLAIGTVDWNSVILTPAILLPSYTSSQLTIETECNTPTSTPTESATHTDTATSTIGTATFTIAPPPTSTATTTVSAARSTKTMTYVAPATTMAASSSAATLAATSDATSAATVVGTSGSATTAVVETNAAATTPAATTSGPAAATTAAATTGGATSTTTVASSYTNSSSGSTGNGGVIAGRAGAAPAGASDDTTLLWVPLAFLFLFLLLLILFLIYWFCIRKKPEVKVIPEMDADADAEGGDAVSPPEYGIQPVATGENADGAEGGIPTMAENADGVEGGTPTMAENADGVEGGTPTMADPQAFEDVVEDQAGDALTCHAGDEGDGSAPA